MQRFARCRKISPRSFPLAISRSSSNIVRCTTPFDVTSIPNMSYGKFLLQEYENNPSWKDDLVVVEGTTKNTLTFGQSYDQIYRTASALSNFGISYNHGVAILSPNHINFINVFIGTTLTGGYVISLNPMNGDDELKYQLDLAEAKIVFVHPLMIAKVLPIADKLKIPVISLDNVATVEGVMNYSQFLSEEKIANIDTNAFPPKSQNFDYESVAVVPFSSGTTGKSKGVVLTHKNLISNLLQVKTVEGDVFGRRDATGNRTVSLIPLPYFHIFGMSAGLAMPLYTGTLSVTMAQFDLQRFLELIQEYKVTRAYVVPPIIVALVKHPMVANYDLSSIQYLLSGAAPLGAEVRAACEKRLNCIVKNAWGLTETSPAASMTLDKDAQSPSSWKGASGTLIPGTEGKIIHPGSGEDLPYSQEGEILVRGPQVMKGYLKNKEATDATLRADGWLHTGDIGYFDDQGFLYITDRSKELIKYKGFQVPPAELEAVILTMPQVQDVIVIPVPDEDAGEVPRAYVVKQVDCPETFSDQDVIEFVASKVAPHKKLRGGVRFVSSVPKSPSGKLLRRVQIQIDREMK